MISVTRTVTLLVVAAAGFGVAHLAFHWIPVDVNAIILGAFGIVAALINATSFQVLRRLDDPPVKDLTLQGAVRVQRTFEQRRRGFRIKWSGAVLFGIAAAMCGGLIKAQSVERYYPEFLRIGYVSLVLTLTLGILITVEYVKLSKLARELPEELAERRRKADLLSRLQADVEEKKESPADAP